MKEPSLVDTFIIKQKLQSLLEEDLGYGDITSNLIPNKKIRAKIIAKSEGIIAGLLEAAIICDLFKIKVEHVLEDGMKVSSGDQIMILSGNIRNILGTERTILNFIMRMSSIASSTHEMVNKIKNAGFKTRIAATRKTIPGFRYFEKRAVVLGGGDPHRWRLDDMVLIKDTHLDAILTEGSSISDIIKKSKEETSFSKKIEIEVENEQSAIEAANMGADIIMFDNMESKDIERSIIIIKENCKKKYMNTPLFESSGNITTKNLMEYVKSGVNIISTSEITMNPSKTMDVSLKYIKNNGAK